MKRRQKRVLQMAFLFTMTLVFLPNVGLWSLYKERHLMKTHDAAQISGRIKETAHAGYPPFRASAAVSLWPLEWMRSR